MHLIILKMFPISHASRSRNLSTLFFFSLCRPSLAPFLKGSCCPALHPFPCVCPLCFSLPKINDPLVSDSVMDAGASFCYYAYILRISEWDKKLRFQGIFVQLMTIWEYKVLARAIKIQNENWGYPWIFQS